jgi:pimeloyl-ACP methyl ester carboxylesterase
MSLIADAQARLKRLEERLAPKKTEKEKKGEGAEQTEEAKEAKEKKDTKDTKEAKEAEPEAEEEPQPAVKLGDATVVATLKESLRMVRRLLEKDDAETDLPGVRLLQEAEELAGGESGAGGGKLWQRPGEYWVTLASGTRTQRARLLIPVTQVRQGTGDAAGERAAGAGASGIGGQEGERAPRRPLVVALHGAGGSENMFFDAYGAGKIVRLCEERGWMLVSLGTSPLGGGLELPVLVDVLGEHYTVDEGRVAVVGHSMGAMQGLQLAGRNPRALRSLAILGGGRPVRSPAVLRGVDLFAAAGAEDFGRGGVKQVIAQWRKAGLPIEERDYPQVEHLGVVQVALDDVFAQFEKSFARVGGTEQ